MPTKQLKLPRPGEVLAAGVILGLACHPRILFLLGVWGEGLEFYFWPPPFLALCFLTLPWPEGWEERPLWVSLGGCLIVALDRPDPWGLFPQPFL